MAGNNALSKKTEKRANAKLEDLYKLRQDTSGLRKRIVAKIETFKLIGFKLNDEEFVIEIERVKEIVKVPLVTRVSQAPHFVEGIANLRGDILQIVNFHKIMGLENSPITDKSRIVVLDDKNVLAAIIVDSVSEVIEVEKEAVQTTPDIVAGERSKFLRGIIKPHKHRNILWLDCASIYSEFSAQNEKSVA
jgi:purine-binding chemotaxis protein CheW